MEPVYFKQSFWRGLVFSSAGLLMNYVCILGATGEIEIKKSSYFFQFFCIIGILFFSIITILSIVELVFDIARSKPFLIISIEGLNHNSIIFNWGFISWNNIQNMYIDNAHKLDKWDKRNDVIIELKDIKNVLKQASYFTRIALRTQTLFFQPKSIIEIRFTLSKLPSSEVLQIMQQYKAEYDRVHQAKDE